MNNEQARSSNALRSTHHPRASNFSMSVPGFVLVRQELSSNPTQLIAKRHYVLSSTPRCNIDDTICAHGSPRVHKQLTERETARRSRRKVLVTMRPGILVPPGGTQQVQFLARGSIALTTRFIVAPRKPHLYNLKTLAAACHLALAQRPSSRVWVSRSEFESRDISQCWIEQFKFSKWSVWFAYNYVIVMQF